MSSEDTGKPVVSKDAIAGGLRELGIRQGDCLFAHSSLSAFGHVDGGAEAVCDALTGTVGEDGTAAVPTFTWRRYNDKETVVFDVVNDSTENGAIPNTFRQRPDALRSEHVCHSIAAIGPGAPDVMGDGIRPFAWGSSMYRLYERDFWYVFLGCGFTACTALHTVEELARVPYRHYRHYIGSVVRRPGGTETPSRAVEFLTLRPYHNDFGKMHAVFARQGMLRTTRVGSADIICAKTRDIVDAGLRLVRDEPGYLLSSESRQHLARQWRAPEPPPDGV